MVWLDGCNLHTNQPTVKLATKCHSPIKVTQVMSPVNYHLELPIQWHIHPVFHINLLMKYNETPMHGTNYQRPLLELIDGVTSRQGCSLNVSLMINPQGQNKKARVLSMSYEV